MLKADFPAEESGLEARAAAAAELLIRRLSALSQSLVLAESCTAGLVADLLARMPGASSVLWGSFVCYTRNAKISMLGLEAEMLEQYGLVSRETACGMAVGALKKSGASMAAAVTGLAGPDGDGSAVPLGTVWIATARRGEAGKNVTESAMAGEFHFTGSRNVVRLAAAAAALEALIKGLDN